MPPSESKFYSARIVERREISGDLWAIRVDPGGEFIYRSGQYATLGIVTPEKHHERPYSIVSAPHEKYVEFFFELVPSGQLTPRLYKAQVGDQITATPRTTPLLGYLERSVEFDRQKRLASLARLRDLAASHRDEVEIFCAHDPVEFDRAAANSLL